MAKRGRPRKIRVTKENIQEARIELKKKANKRKTSPGPWTDIGSPIEVKVRLRITNGIMGEVYGTYPKYWMKPEKGWYIILFNVTSKSIMRDVEVHGIDNYLAACEMSLNTPENKKKYGTVVYYSNQLTTRRMKNAAIDSFRAMLRPTKKA